MNNSLKDTANPQKEIVSSQKVDKVGLQILKAFHGPNDTLRSPGGIARDTGLPLNEVNSYLEQHSKLFEKFPLKPGGTTLYSLKPAWLGTSSKSQK